MQCIYKCLLIRLIHVYFLSAYIYIYTFFNHSLYVTDYNECSYHIILNSNYYKKNHFVQNNVSLVTKKTLTEKYSEKFTCSIYYFAFITRLIHQ